MKRQTAFTILFLGSVTLLAQDVTGSTDHAMFSRMPGFYISDYGVEEFASEEFVDELGNDRTIEGKKTLIRYECACNESPLRIIRNYANAAAKVGGKSYEYSDNSLYINIVKGPHETWVNVWASTDVYMLTIVEKGEMVQDITATWMLDELNRSGRVTLYIRFDTGKSTIRPESRPVTDEIIHLMQETGSLKLSVEGHTDDVGTEESNLILSENRAAAVVEAIVAGGIDKSRLSKAGYGESKPIADNSTEEGRAQNRRVELVKR